MDISAFYVIALFLIISQEVLCFSPGQRQRVMSRGVMSMSLTELQEIDTAIKDCKEVLNRAADKKAEPLEVISSMEALEKLMRKRNKVDESTAEQTLRNLEGSWKLVFTTGTAGTQKKLGKINYFPIKAVQSFQTAEMTLNNGIYIGDFAILQFYGEFDFNMKSRKLEFDFDRVKAFGIQFNLKKGKEAARDKKAFFNWISSDEYIATARGGGGGLALWKRL